MSVNQPNPHFFTHLADLRTFYLLKFLKLKWKLKWK